MKGNPKAEKVWNLKKPPRQKLIAKRYALEKELGRGGGGTVHLAKDRNRQNQKVALKVVPLNTSEDPTLASSLKNEFATLTLLHHPHLAQVHDFGVTDKEMYVSSEWVDGEDILRATEKTDLNTVFRLLVQILRAVDFLHRKGVLHLDLKPANILVTVPDRTGDLSVKLIDFGLAQWKKMGSEGSGEFFGTPPYAAPEVVIEQPPSPASDIYSLGMIFHQIFARRFPFKSQDPMEIMKEQIYGDPLPVELNPALPEDFSHVLLKMVAKDPKTRLASPQEVLDAINQSLGENFSLRSRTAPIRILEESDFMFRPDLLEELASLYASGGTPLQVLSGPSGIGKTRLLSRLKEILQLRGTRALLFGEVDSLKEFLKTQREGNLSPLFLDVPELSEEALQDLLSYLQRKPFPVLLATSHPKPTGSSPFEWRTIDPLTPEQIGAFLKAEVQDFPFSSFGDPWLSLLQGSPMALETLLQSLREEGMLRWTERGWQWAEAGAADLGRILERQESRWQERLHRIREVLKFSRVGLNAATLEGILSLEAGALAERLKKWSEDGDLLEKKSEGGFLYFIKTEAQTQDRQVLPKDWNWIQTELERLYDQGEFDTGVEWAHVIDSERSSGEPFPLPVSLVCARHYAAAGLAAEALETLPSSPPEDPASAGLFHEIRARARFALGDIANTQADLKVAEDLYRSCGEKSGLSRALNLQGIVFKKLCDFTASETYYHGAIQAAEEADNPYLQGIAQMNLGIFYNEQGQIDRAYSTYQDTFRLAEKADHPLLHCLLRHNWVNLVYHMGRASEAETACYEWLKLSIKHRYPELQAAALNYLALLSSLKNHHEMQLMYLNQAVALLNPDKNTQLLFQTLMNRSYLYFDLKKITAAQLDGEAALTLAQKRSLTDLAVLAHILLGKIFRDRPKPDSSQAEDFFQKALKAAEQSRNRQLVWNVLYEMGILAKKKKETEEAKKHFLSAKRELEQFLKDMPEHLRPSYLRDRKMESILSELESL